jgi:CRP-like cAMP-binding protein
MDTHWHIGENDFFNGLEKERKAFLAIARRKVLQKNDMVFFEEDSGDSCFYLESGLIKIFQISATGKEPIFFLRRSGEMFGLAEVMDGKNRKANAQTLAPCIIYESPRAAFEKFLEENYKVARKVIKTLGRRLRYLGEIAGGLMVCDVSTRLTKLLAYLCHEYIPSEKGWRRPLTIPIKLTQEQLASMVGSTQQTVSELLKECQQSGLIVIKNRQITVVNPLRLLETVEI